jgi:ABC-type proline/glycine betaine transport system substrate-binding protein
LLVLCTLALSGCGGFGQGKVLTLASMGWDENVAVSSLTKALPEDDLGYERVYIAAQKTACKEASTSHASGRGV